MKLKKIMAKRFKSESVFFRFIRDIKKLIAIAKYPKSNREFVRISLLNQKKYKNLDMEVKEDERFTRSHWGTIKAYLVPSAASLLFSKLFTKPKAKQKYPHIVKTLVSDRSQNV